MSNMKTHAEIDAVYRAAVTHSHDAAIDAVYEAGAQDARAEMRTQQAVPVAQPVFEAATQPAAVAPGGKHTRI